MWSPEYKKNISFHMGNTVITKVNFKLKTEQQSNGLKEQTISNEQLWPIGRKARKRAILMTINASKELAFYADFK